ncbi:MAG: flagellar biosynthetic protein FliR [Lachnospiraceae bacterium]|nr:flagellar biosynthetic protein FliR [Lachnospiraceae bacterium]
MTFTVEQFEFFLMIMVRISAFIYTAPFFSIGSVPQRVKVGLSAVLSYLMFTLLPYEPLSYSGSLGFLIMIALNAIAGFVMGFFANINTHILSFTGQIVDMQIGFSMATEYDPATRTTVSLSSNIFNYAVMLILLVTRLHYYIIEAILDSFHVIPIAEATLQPEIYKLMLQFIIDFCVIGFRIALPVFAATLIANTVLAILAKVAPQMNMFVIGMQMKVLIGLAVLAVVTLRLDAISDAIFDEMYKMLRSVIPYLH